jgi:hypothetical protein
MATTVDEFGSVVEIATAEEQLIQQNNEYIASGGANDETGNQNTGISSPTTYYESDGTPSSSISLPLNAGTTIAGKTSTPAASPSTKKPGKRTRNPLGDFASYTYQLTLYMITPDAYDAFVKSGRRRINAINDVTSLGAAAQPQVVSNGAFVVAQSGGINPSTNRRAPGFDLDYYIDDLKLTTTVGVKENGTATNTQNMTFSIIEPYGFSFVSKLRNATNELQKASRSKNFSKLVDPTRQFFILGVRFQGYDTNGKPMTGKETIAGDRLDPSGNSDGVFERFWDINIRSMKFKIEGKATVYRIEAAAMSPSVAFGTKRGIIDRGAKIVAGTVDEALLGNDPENGVIGLLTKLNNDQKELEKNGSITPGMATTYSLEYLGDAKAQIGNQTIVSKADLDKSKLPMAKSKTTKDSNDALSEEAVPNSNRRQVTFRNGTPILQAIGLIIAQSSYLEKALKQVYTTDLEPSEDSEDEVVNAQTKTIRWYNLSSQVRCKGWDPKTSDFAYEITFLLQPYETPIVISPVVGKTPKYYGPHKRYDYWYTGKNSEIISYEQSMDNTFTNVVIAQNDKKNSQGSGGAAQIPVAPGKQSNQPKQGKLDNGMGAQNEFLTSLFDPGSWGRARVTILGDPDFLMTESAARATNESFVYDQFYGTDGYTINPNGGQVFIEIDFKEAVDYNNKTGIMSLNDRILMQQYPPAIASQVKGVSYMLNKVNSTFSKGKFIQELECTINTFDGISDAEASAGTAAREARVAATSAAPSNNGTSTSANTGFVQDDVTGVDDAVAQQAAINQAAAMDVFYDAGPANQITAPTSNGTEVVNDDAVNTALVPTVEESGRE